MRVHIPSGFNLRRLLTSKHTYISMAILLIMLVLVFLQNKVLPELMSLGELERLSALEQAEIKIFGIFNAPPSLLFALYWLPISLLPGFITPAFVTVVFFAICATLCLLASNAIYRRVWPVATIVLLSGIISSNLTYGYGLRPELLIVGYVYLLLLGLTLMYQSRNLGVVLIVVGASLSPLLGVMGIVLGLLSVGIVSLMYGSKTLRKRAPHLSSTDWFITFGLAFIFMSPFIVMLVQGATYSLNYTVEFSSLLSNTRDFFGLLFVGSGSNPFFWSSNWPMFSIGGLVMIGLGTYALIVWRGAMRNRLLLTFFGIGLLTPIILGVSLESLAIFVAITPFIIVAGFRYLHERWISVFPHNTTAHKISISLLTVFIVAISLYHLNRQLIYLPQVEEFNTLYTYEDS